MASNDLIILEAVNGLEKNIIALQNEIKEIKQEIKDVRQEIRVNTVKIDATHNSINWGFAVVTIVITSVIAIVGLVATLAPTIRESFANKQKGFNEKRMQEIAENAVNNALLLRNKTA